MLIFSLDTIVREHCYDRELSDNVWLKCEALKGFAPELSAYSKTYT